MLFVFWSPIATRISAKFLVKNALAATLRAKGGLVGGNTLAERNSPHLPVIYFSSQMAQQMIDHRK